MRVSEILRYHFRFTEDRIATTLQLGAIYKGEERVFKDMQVKTGGHLIIHLNPHRFPVADIDWKACVIASEPDFLVVRKPGGVPVHGTQDNATENVLEQMRTAVGSELSMTQRLDTPVSGLMVLAKTRFFQEYFNGLLREGKVEKTYKALTLKAPPIGIHTHFMVDKPTRRKRIKTEGGPGLLECRLEVVNVVSLRDPQSGTPFFEVEVRPLSGRTHQIRAQLSALGCPIMADSLYEYKGPRISWSPRREIGLFSHRLKFNLPDMKTAEFEAPCPWEKILQPV